MPGDLVILNVFVGHAHGVALFRAGPFVFLIRYDKMLRQYGRANVIVKNNRFNHRECVNEIIASQCMPFCADRRNEIRNRAYKWRTAEKTNVSSRFIEFFQCSFVGSRNVPYYDLIRRHLAPFIRSPIAIIVFFAHSLVCKKFLG